VIEKDAPQIAGLVRIQLQGGHADRVAAGGGVAVWLWVTTLWLFFSCRETLLFSSSLASIPRDV